jgi:hypothetical protein
MSNTRRAVYRAALLVLGLAAIVLGGCGGKTKAQQAMRQGLEREDLAAVAHTLSKTSPQIRAEVAATKAAWPLVVNGLPTDLSAIPRPPIDAATASAARLRTPALFEEHAATAITGPGAGLAAGLRNFIVLATTGWRMIGAAIDQIEHGTPTTKSFARANVNLYIASVYDAHFSLAQIGKQLLAAYKKLGGPAAFGASLTQQEVDALAQTYSEPSDRLHPHTGVKLEP